MEEVLILFFVASGFVQLIFWLFFYTGVRLYKPNSAKGIKNTLSLIVCCKNEALNLPSCLDMVLEDPGVFQELILVDDYSSDNTARVIHQYQKQDKRIQYFKPSRDAPGKKLALAEAIQLSKSDFLLLTDADCMPASSKWASLMLSQATDAKHIVLGYSPIRKSKGLLNLWCRFETWLTGITYLSFAAAKMPYMGVGRNLLYSKHVFEQTQGFDHHIDLISGDDDLFVNKAANAENIALSLDPESFVYTHSPKTFQEYFHQKIRHYSVSYKYKFHHQLLLTLFPASHIIFYAFLLIMLFFQTNIVVCLYLGFILSKWLLACLLVKKMREGFCYIFPILDFILTGYYLVMAPFLIWRSKSW